MIQNNGCEIGCNLWKQTLEYDNNVGTSTMFIEMEYETHMSRIVVMSAKGNM